MKKYFYYLVLLALPALMATESNAQAFQKGNMNLDLGLGFGAYSTTTTFTFDFFGQPITLSDEDGAASTMVPLIFEYGISNKISLGAQIGFVNYFIDNEDSTETTESVKSVDFALRFGYHFLDAEKNDLYAGIALGGSSVNWVDLSGEEFSGSGSYVSFFITDRIFFNDNIGILFNLAYTGYRYSGLESNRNNAFIDNFEWTLRGVNFGTGLSVKF